MISTFLLLRIEDEPLRGDPAAWAEAAAALDAFASVAEQAGARWSLRVGRAFAEGDSAGMLASLVARGHEVGWLAEGRRLQEAQHAVVHAGGTGRACTPGLELSDASRHADLRDEVLRLGAQLLTDRAVPRDFPWAGWLARWAAPGLFALDLSVAPEDWGGDTTPDFARLSELLERRRTLPPPEGTAAFFGASVALRALCLPHSWTPALLEDVRAFMEGCEGGVRPSLDLAEQLTARAVPAPRPELAPPRLPGVPDALDLLGRLGARPRAWGEDLATRWGAAPPPTHVLEVGARRLRARRVGPQNPVGAIVVVDGEDHGLARGLGFLGLPEGAFGEFAVWTWSRTPVGGKVPGNPVHVAEARAVIAAARGEGLPVGLLAFSGGLVTALLAADAETRCLVDCEGPVDRFSLVPPQDADPVLARASLYEEAPWQNREAVELLRKFSGRYLRLQGRPDHALGVLDLHARRVEAFGERLDVRGTLEQRGAELRDRLGAWMRDALR